VRGARRFPIEHTETAESQKKFAEVKVGTISKVLVNAVTVHMGAGATMSGKAKEA